jgi:hypothetical protein
MDVPWVGHLDGAMHRNRPSDGAPDAEDRRGTEATFQYVPTTSVTGFPTVPQRIDKEKLIIQQNNQCWIGVPGATCNPKIRTYA